MSVVAIVGRPNVGKSTIFNLLTKSKSAIVADYSGLTRDRKYGNLKDTNITLIDTGGINEESDDMSHAIMEQTDLAIFWELNPIRHAPRRFLTGYTLFVRRA